MKKGRFRTDKVYVGYASCDKICKTYFSIIRGGLTKPYNIEGETLVVAVTHVFLQHVYEKFSIAESHK